MGFPHLSVSKSAVEMESLPGGLLVSMLAACSCHTSIEASPAPFQAPFSNIEVVGCPGKSFFTGYLCSACCCARPSVAMGRIRNFCHIKTPAAVRELSEPAHCANQHIQLIQRLWPVNSVGLWHVQTVAHTHGAGMKPMPATLCATRIADVERHPRSSRLACSTCH